jgi:Tol biopolymer transport system component
MRSLLLVTAAAFTAMLIGPAVLANATAPGPNGRIVFRRFLDVGKTRSALFTVNPDGTKVRQVTHPGSGVIDLEPDWSPSGSEIAFERQVPCPAGGPRDGLQNTCDRVYTVKANGKGLKPLVPCRFKIDPSSSGSSRPGVDCVGADQPAWSPDGSRIAFQYNLVDSTYTGSLKVDAGIWIVNADGSGLHQVTERTPGTGWDLGPQWSPDGSKLVFFRSDFSEQADAVFTVAVDGSNEFQVTPWTLGAGDSPDWSPDGQWLLFRAQPKDGSSNVYKAHPDGTALTNLTHQPAGGYHYLSPSYSPDGSKIVTARTPGTGPEGAADLVVMNADGTNAHAITRTRLWESAPDWGPLAKRTLTTMTSCLGFGGTSTSSACVSEPGFTAPAAASQPFTSARELLAFLEAEHRSTQEVER